VVAAAAAAEARAAGAEAERAAAEAGAARALEERAAAEARLSAAEARAAEREAEGEARLAEALVALERARAESTRRDGPASGTFAPGSTGASDDTERQLRRVGAASAVVAKQEPPRPRAPRPGRPAFLRPSRTRAQSEPPLPSTPPPPLLPPDRGRSAAPLGRVDRGGGRARGAACPTGPRVAPPPSRPCPDASHHAPTFFTKTRRKNLPRRGGSGSGRGGSGGGGGPLRL